MLGRASLIPCIFKNGLQKSTFKYFLIRKDHKCNNEQYLRFLALFLSKERERFMGLCSTSVHLLCVRHFAGSGAMRQMRLGCHPGGAQALVRHRPEVWSLGNQ